MENSELFAKYINRRLFETKNIRPKDSKFFPTVLKRQSLPDLANEILETPQLWTPESDYLFVPAWTIKTLFNRVDGHPVDPHQASVFWHDLYRRIETLGVDPIAMRPKQRHQIFDKRFTHAIFASIAYNQSSQIINADKIAYRLDQKYTITDVIRINLDVVEEIVTSQAKYIKYGPGRRPSVDHFMR